jgi:hypothetical protein
MKNLVKPSFSLLAIALLALPGHAITVGNYDFVSPATPASGYFLAPGADGGSGGTTVDDWTFSDSESVGGVANSTDVPTAVGQNAFFNNTDDGSNSDPTVFPLNTITYSGTGGDALPTIASGASYTLTVALGVPSGQPSEYSLSLLAGSTPFATATIDSDDLGVVGSGTTATGGGYTDFYDFSVTLSAATIAADNLGGQQLGIQLGSQEDSTAEPYATNGDYSQTYFSDVRLVETPEPSTFALMGLAGGLGMLLLRGRMRQSRLS